MTKHITIILAGKTEAGSAEAQPARDNRLKATNCRWGGSYTPAAPSVTQRQFRALLCLKKPNKQLRRRRIQYLPKAEIVS